MAFFSRGIWSIIAELEHDTSFREKRDVFVCYNSMDYAQVDGIVKGLINHGIHCWVCSKEPPGTDWTASIDTMIAKARCALVMLGVTISDWQRREMVALMNANKKLIPCLLSRGAVVPVMLANIQHVKCYEDIDLAISKLVDGVMYA